MIRRRLSTKARPHALLAGLRVSVQPDSRGAGPDQPDSRGAGPDRALPDSLRRWIDAEQTFVHRRVDRRLLDPGTISEVPQWLRPEARSRLVFPSVWLEDGEGIGRAPPGLSRVRHGRQQQLYLWHPASEAKVARFVRDAEPGPRFFGAVTSSIRTVLLWPAEQSAIAPFFAKFSLPLELGGAPRLLDRAHVQEAVEATELLRLVDTAFTFVPEPFGVVPRQAPDASFIVRTVPTGRWMPFFAFTAPKRAPRDARILDRLVDAWLEAALDGMALEAHAQNVLVEVDARRRPTGRFGFRDLHGVTVDANALARRFPALAARIDRLVAKGTPLFRDPDEALADSFHRFVLGGPAAGFANGQARAVNRLGRRLGVDATSPEEVVAAVHVERSRQLEIPAPPRWLARFLSRDQGPNDRTREPTFFAPVDLSPLPRAYDPSRRPVWPVETLELRPSELEVLGSRRWARRVGGLVLHPFMRTRLGLLGLRPLRRTRFFASPTSSPRTLALWDAAGTAFAVKVSLDVELLGLSRLVHGSKLRRAVAIDRCLEAIDPATLRREGVTFLREPAALRVRERDDGQIVRQLEPFLGDVAPGFGLFAQGGWVDRVPAAQLLDQLERRVLRPLASVSAFLFFEEGLIGQLHQQNVLFALGRTGAPTGHLVIRDLDAFAIDARVRRARGRPSVALRHRVEVGALYDRAWGRSCRGDFGFLAERVLLRRGRRADLDELYRRFDRAFLLAAERHLGSSIVRSELDWVRRRSPRLADRVARSEWTSAQLLDRSSASSWFLEGDRRQIGYSVNALVHAWVKARQ